MDKNAAVCISKIYQDTVNANCDNYTYTTGMISIGNLTADDSAIFITIQSANPNITTASVTAYFISTITNGTVYDTITAEVAKYYIYNRADPNNSVFFLVTMEETSYSQN